MSQDDKPGVEVWYWWVIDHTDTVISAHQTRHDAIGAKTRYHDCNDYLIRPVTPLATLYRTPKRNRTGVYP